MKIPCSIILAVVAQFGVGMFTAAAHPSSGIVVDEQGQIFFSDLSRGLLKIDRRGKVTTVHREGGHWLALDPKGSFSKMDFEKSPHWPRWFKRRTPAGVRPALLTDGGSPLVVAPDGNLYYVCNDEQMTPGGLQIARLTPDGRETLLNPSLRRTAEELGGIKGLAVGPDGSLYASFSKAVLKITTDGKVTTLLNPVVVDDCDKHPPSLEDAPFLRGLAVDARGMVYVAATGCRRIIKISPDGKVSTVLKAESPWSPCGVAVHGEDIYVLEHINPNSEAHEDWPPRVRKLARDGKVTTLVTFASGKNAASSDNEAQTACNWELAIPPGKGRFPEVCGEGYWPMAIVPLVALDNKLWMVSAKTVWSSSDGIRWNAQPKTDWGERAGMAYAFFDHKFWMLGGMRTWDDFKNDVWYSSNGTEWKRATPDAGWVARRNHAVTVFNNRLWVLGGAESSGRADQVPKRFFNDVWSSADGVHWTQITAAAPWSARDGHACLVLDNRLWLIGGTGKRDVWYSNDGQTWTQATAKAEWKTRHSNGAIVLDGKLWVFGGRGLNDVWCSANGTRWRRIAKNAPWSPRTTIHSTVFDNKLWIYGGKTGREDSWAGDVWTMTCSK